VLKKLYTILFFAIAFVFHEPILTNFWQKCSQGNLQYEEPYLLIIDSFSDTVKNQLKCCWCSRGQRSEDIVDYSKSKIAFWSKIYINSKDYGAKISNFTDKGWNVNNFELSTEETERHQLHS